MVGAFQARHRAQFTLYTQIALLIILLVGLLHASLAYGAVEASVDRSVIGEQESLTLTLSSDTARGPGPDLTELESDFEILTQRQNTRIQVVNGRQSRSRQWHIVLAPKRSGELVIPSLELDNERTAPIRIKVEPRQVQYSGEMSRVFLDAKVEQDSVYLQQQLIYRVRLYYARQITDPFIKPPELNDALVLQLGEQKNHETRLQGRRYGVAEWTYAIFPQTSGTLTIPAQTFTGKLVEGRRLFNQKSRFIRIQSPQVSIEVKPQPSSYPQAPWLPAKRLRLTQSWSADPTQLRVGEPITRTLTLQGEGITASALPEISHSLDDFSQYAEQPQLQEKTHAQGVAASRQESVALVPTRPGKQQLPALRIPWWNTATGQLEYAQLPAMEVEVAPAATATSDTPLFSGGETAAGDPDRAAEPPELPWLWVGTTLLFGMGWLITLILWLQARRHPPPSDDQPTNTLKAQSEKDAYRTLIRCCQEQRPHQARLALLAWAQRRWPEAGFTHLHQLTTQFQQPELTRAIDTLEAALYGPDAGTQNWHGEDLLLAIQALRQQSGPNGQHPVALPPLYAAADTLKS